MYDLKLAQIRKQPGGEYFYTWLALYSLPHEYVTELQARRLAMRRLQPHVFRTQPHVHVPSHSAPCAQSCSPACRACSLPRRRQGALRISAAVIGGTVDPPTHTVDEETEAREDDNPLVLMPHLVRWTYYSLFVAIYRVEGLPNMDEHGATDASLTTNHYH